MPLGFFFVFMKCVCERKDWIGLNFFHTRSSYKKKQTKNTSNNGAFNQEATALSLNQQFEFCLKWKLNWPPLTSLKLLVLVERPDRKSCKMKLKLYVVLLNKKKNNDLADDTEMWRRSKILFMNLLSRVLHWGKKQLFKWYVYYLYDIGPNFQFKDGKHKHKSLK